MSVWVCMPSKRPAAEVEAVLEKWHAMGYKTAVLRDHGDAGVGAHILLMGQGHYAGWGASINLLAAEVFHDDPDCDWIVGGSDDMWPDPNVQADKIAEQCSAYFGQRGPAERVDDWTVKMTVEQYQSAATFGVMQPTGDLKHWPGSRVDRICGSPWLGREFCRRMYGGRGAFFEEYRHMFDDEELFEVAKMLGVLWQRPDLTHHHEHFLRHGAAPTPPHLVNAVSRENWQRTKALFNARKAAGFPGHEPIP
jgi:hypothetical protein